MGNSCMSTQRAAAWQLSVTLLRTLGPAKPGERCVYPFPMHVVPSSHRPFPSAATPRTRSVFLDPSSRLSFLRSFVAFLFPFPEPLRI